jgi:hypothetical protein
MTWEVRSSPPARNSGLSTITQLASSSEAAIISPSSTWRSRPTRLWAANGRLIRAAAASGGAAR